MERNFKGLDQGPFDLLIIGGGIYGAWAALDAALRGFKVAIVEKGDWASGTSSASSKLLHGGLRYLEQYRFRMVRKSLDERRRLYSLARHGVKPLRFVVPLYRGGRVGRVRLQAGLWLYDVLAGRDQPVARHTSLGVDEVRQRYPFMSVDGLAGALTYGDCQIDDALFVLEVIDGAVEEGVVAVNYAAATGLIEKNGRVLGVRVADRLGDDETDVLASIVVNAAGPWAPDVVDGNHRGRVRLSKGVHLVMPALGTEDALLVMTKRDRRVFFIVPWYGRTLLGTTDSDYGGDLDNVTVEDADIEYLLGEANTVLSNPWTPSMILGGFAGVRALKYEPGKSPDSVTREWVLHSPRKGMLVSTGGKYTSARADAAEIVDRATSIVGRASAAAAPTSARPTPWSPHGDFDAWRDDRMARATQLLDAEAARHCLRYGKRLDEVLTLIDEDPGLAARVDADLPFVRAEILWAARYGMVATLEDIVRRRIPLVALSRPSRQTLQAVAELVAPALGWDSNRCRSEVDRVLEKQGA